MAFLPTARSLRSHPAESNHFASSKMRHSIRASFWSVVALPKATPKVSVNIPVIEGADLAAPKRNLLIFFTRSPGVRKKCPKFRTFFAGSLKLFSTWPERKSACVVVSF